MALLDDVGTRRELVERLVLAELLARRGRGPLALRSAPGFAVRATQRTQLAPRAPVPPPGEPKGEDEP